MSTDLMPKTSCRGQSRLGASHLNWPGPGDLPVPVLVIAAQAHQSAAHVHDLFTDGGEGGQGLAVHPRVPFHEPGMEINVQKEATAEGKRCGDG